MCVLVMRESSFCCVSTFIRLQFFGRFSCGRLQLLPRAASIADALLFHCVCVLALRSALPFNSFSWCLAVVASGLRCARPRSTARPISRDTPH